MVQNESLKNIKEFCGRPIIAYSIEAALKSKCFDEVMVSTDSEEIAEIAKNMEQKYRFCVVLKHQMILQLQEMCC